jgi:hypothetical protein
MKTQLTLTARGRTTELPTTLPKGAAVLPLLYRVALHEGEIYLLAGNTVLAGSPVGKPDFKLIPVDEQGRELTNPA